MIIENEFHLVHLSGKYYLLPYGQETAGLKHGIQLNDTSVLLWNGLEKGLNASQLCDMLLLEYGLAKTNRDDIYQDILEFIQKLDDIGAITLSDNPSTPVLYDSLYFQTGPLKICFQGPQNVFQSYFSDFSCPPAKANQTITVFPFKPAKTENGTVILRRNDLLLMETEEKYIFLFPTVDDFYEMQTTKDGSYVSIFCEDTLQENTLFHIIRFPFILMAQSYNCFLLHSASLLYQEKAWLFSGMSGTGKSTHTKLWHTLFDTPLLNGDLNMLGIEHGVAMVYGQPWCGTSDICTSKSYPLGGITFLKQGQKNICLPLNKTQTTLQLIQRMISPTWKRNLLMHNAEFSESISDKALFFELQCLPEDSSAITMKKSIDDALS